MLFQQSHIEDIISGRKTETRRKWDSPQVKEGNSYRATTDLFTPRDESPAYIIVEEVYKERLGDIDAESAQAEGGYSVDEFERAWQEINGDWNPDEDVWVVEFRASETDPRKETNESG